MPHDGISPALVPTELDDYDFAPEPTEQPSVFSAMKNAGRAIVKTAKRVGGKGMLSAMMAAGSVLCVPHASAQWGCTAEPIPRCTLVGVNPNLAQGSPTDMPGGASAGDPINLATGNVYLHLTDYKTAGQNPLEFTRYYNSLGANTGTTFATTLGQNWRSNYDRYLQISPSTGPTSVIVERADGQQINFTLTGSTWTTDANIDYSLTHSGSTWTLKDHNDTTEVYTDSGTGKGVLDSITLRNSYQQNLSYSGGLLQTVTDSYSRSLSFTYSSGLMQTVTTPEALVLSYGYTYNVNYGFNTLTGVAYNTSPATSQTYLYEDTSYPSALTGVIDENGNRSATWGYDSHGRGNSSQSGGSLAANLTTVNSYPTDPYNPATTVTNAFGVTDTYKFYAGAQNSPRVVELDRAATSTTAAASELFGFDGNGYSNSKTDWNGNQTTWVNNGQGNPTTINEAVGSTVARTTTVSYDPTWIRLPHQIVTAGLTSTFGYDGSGNPLTRTDLDTTTNTVPYSTNGQTRVFTWTWNSTGEETSVQLPRTDVTAKTTFGYTSGTLTSIEDALGHTTTISSYTGGGRPLTVIDPNSVQTTLTYDGRLNLHTSTLHTGAGNLVTTWTHDPANNLTAVQWPDNSKLTFGLDAANRLTKITDLPGNTINYTPDALGDITLTQVKNPSGTVTASHSGSFDALGRPLTDVGGMSQTTSYTWDPNSNPLTITPPSPSGTVTWTWDALNRPATRVDPSPGGTTTFKWDAHNLPLSVKDANAHSTTYVNDGFGDRTQTASPDSGTTIYTYDADRNLTQRVKAGTHTTDGSYDALDRPLTRTFPADTSLNVTFTWDQTTGHGFGIGRLTSVTDKVGSLANIFDERGDVTNESRVITSVGTLNTATTFDAAQNVSGITYPSGTVVANTRNSMGLVTAITAKPPGASSASNVVTGVTYEPFGPATGLTFGNGITGTYGYDLDYRPTTRVDANGSSSVMNLTYGYFTNNSIHTITDAVNAANSQTLAYNAVDALTSATSGTGGYGTYGWTWDAVGNVKTQVVSGTTTTFSLASGTNRISQWVTGSTTDTVAYMAAGNISTVTSGSTTLDTLGYNEASQMTSGATPTTSATYKYGFTGERLEKTVSGSHAVVFQYGQAARELLSENDLHSGQTADYIYLNNKPVGEVNPTTGALYFTHTDMLGTPQKLTDSTKATAWSGTYSPFGTTVSFSGTLATQSIRLPGQYFDPETGMNNNGFREYAGSITRYVQTDPIGLGGGMNTYQYVKGNPTKYTDARGLDPGTGDTGQNTDCGLLACPTFTAPPPPSLQSQVLAGACGDSAASKVLSTIGGNIIYGAGEGAYEGFIGGEVLGGPETLGLSGLVGAGVGGFVGGVVYGTIGAVQGGYTAIACSAMGAYNKPKPSP